MDGQPWPELELHDWPWGAHRRGGRGEGKGRGAQGHVLPAWRAGRERHGGKLVEEGSSASCRLLCSFFSFASMRLKKGRRERKIKEKK
jgi:hypothetical protein